MEYAKNKVIFYAVNVVKYTILVNIVNRFIGNLIKNIVNDLIYYYYLLLLFKFNIIHILYNADLAHFG